MVSALTPVNPALLQWARDSMGLSFDDVAAKMGLPRETVVAWESGETNPTYAQLERLAARVYKRPIAVFFFPAPPRETEFRSEFRALPDADLAALEPDTRLALREALARQLSLNELSGGRNPAPQLITREIQGYRSSRPKALAAAVRKVLGISVAEQQRWTNNSEAFRRWREAVEDAGVFVFKRSFQQKDISGFCIHDDEFPIIMINNSTSAARQSFTLFHELGHLLYRVNGVTFDNPFHFEHLNPAYRRIEIACNRFAAELLLPEDSIDWSSVRIEPAKSEAEQLAKRYKVSSEVVLRSFLDRDLIDRSLYASITAEWNQAYTDTRGQSAGGNYYATQATYLGNAFLALTFGEYYKGRISATELSDHLGIRGRNVEKLETFVFRER